MSVRDVGRWGEALVFQYLVREASRVGGHVEWMNQEEESGISYDIKMYSASKSHSETKFIEVKSTRFGNRSAFHFTPSEYEYAKQLGNSFLIYRVFNAGTKSASISIIPNPYKLLEDREIKLCVSL